MPEHFSDPHGSLLTIGDAGVGYSLSMEPEEVRIMRYQNSPSGSGKRELRRIVSAKQRRFGRRCHVDTAPPQTNRDAGRDVFV